MKPDLARRSRFLYTGAVRRFRPPPLRPTRLSSFPPMRYFVIFVLICILASLFSALFFMFKDKGDSRRMVKALTLRVALSVSLFLLLMAAYFFGFIGKEGL